MDAAPSAAAAAPPPRLAFLAGLGAGAVAAAAATAWFLRKPSDLAKLDPWSSLRRRLAELLKHRGRAVLFNCRVVADAVGASYEEADSDGFIRVDLHFVAGKLVTVGRAAAGAGAGAGGAAAAASSGGLGLDLGGRVLCGRFSDAHVHLTKTQLQPRRPNPTGSMSGALACEAADRPRWLREQEQPGLRSLTRRMEFAVRCAACHGSRALRTHLDGVQEGGMELRDATYEAFEVARRRWAARGVALQGVANLFLPHYRGEAGRSREEARAHVVEASRHHGVVLGAYVPKPGGTPTSDSVCFTKWFDALFALAAEFNMPVDLHIDEHNSGDPAALALPYLVESLRKAQKQFQYSQPVVLGHCTALAACTDDKFRKDLIEMIASLGSQVTVVSNPLTNVWLQDRRGTSAIVGSEIDAKAPRTPKWRGITLLQELRAAGVRVAAASDNVRDWWYPYGDYDVLEVFKLVVHLAHLDTTHKDGLPPAAWLSLVTDGASDAMGLGSMEFLQVGEPLSACLFDARSISELLARPQSDRQVIIASAAVERSLPAFSDLDDLVSELTPLAEDGPEPRRGGT